MEKIKRIIKQIQAVQFNEGGIISSSGMRTLDNSIRELKAFETLAECVQDMPDCPEVDGLSPKEAERLMQMLTSKFNVDELNELAKLLIKDRQYHQLKNIQSHNSDSDGRRISDERMEDIYNNNLTTVNTGIHMEDYMLLNNFKAALRELELTKTD